MKKHNYSEMAIIGVGHIGHGVTHSLGYALKNQKVIIVDDIKVAQTSQLNFSPNTPVVMKIKPHENDSNTFKAADSSKINEPKNYINGKPLPNRNKKKK